MPRKVQERGLYLRESSERAGDLLLMEERVVYTVLRFTLTASTSLCHSSVYHMYSDMFHSLLYSALLSLPFHSFPFLQHLFRLFCSPLFFTRLSPDFSLPPSLPPFICRALLYLTGVSLWIPRAASRLNS